MNTSVEDKQTKEFKPESPTKGNMSNSANVQSPLPDALKALPGHPKFAGAIRSLVTAVFGNPRIAAAKDIAKHGLVYYGESYGQKALQINDPELAQFILRREGKLIQSEVLDTVRNVLGKASISTVHGELHAKLRQLMSGAFSPKSLEKLCPMIEKAVEENLEEFLETGRIKDAGTALRGITLEVSCKVVLGSEGVPKERFVRLRDDLIAVSRAMVSIPLNTPGMTYHKGLKARARVLEFIKERVEVQRKKLEDAELGLEDGADTGYTSILEELVRTKESDAFSDISYEVIGDNVITLLFAAMDTTASTINGLTLSLCHRPDVLEKLEEEQNRIISEYGTELNPDIVSKMMYLDASIWEFLQVHPPSPGTFRRAIADFDLPGYDVRVAKGTLLMVGYHGQQNAENPETGLYSTKDRVLKVFDPDRVYEAMKVGKTDSKPWMAFGFGKRHCIGAPLANLVLRVFFALFIRKTSFHMDPLMFPSFSYVPVPSPKEKFTLVFSRK